MHPDKAFTNCLPTAATIETRHIPPYRGIHGGPLMYLSPRSSPVAYGKLSDAKVPNVPIDFSATRLIPTLQQIKSNGLLLWNISDILSSAGYWFIVENITTQPFTVSFYY
jgi:hypothetical protein